MCHDFSGAATHQQPRTKTWHSLICVCSCFCFRCRVLVSCSSTTPTSSSGAASPSRIPTLRRQCVTSGASRAQSVSRLSRPDPQTVAPTASCTPLADHIPRVWSSSPAVRLRQELRHLSAEPHACQAHSRVLPPYRKTPMYNVSRQGREPQSQHRAPVARSHPFRVCRTLLLFITLPFLIRLPESASSTLARVSLRLCERLARAAVSELPCVTVLESWTKRVTSRPSRLLHASRTQGPFSPLLVARFSRGAQCNDLRVAAAQANGLWWKQRRWRGQPADGRRPESGQARRGHCHAR